MGDKKECPLHNFSTCIEQNCAWWYYYDHSAGLCAVPAIAEKIDFLTNKIKN